MHGFPVSARRFRAVLCVIALICATAGSAGSQQVVAPQLTLVGIGSMPPDLMTSMVAHFERRYQMRIDTVPPLTFDQLTFDPNREQVVAERLIQSVRFRYPRFGRDPRARVIAITSLDMYNETMKDRWMFSFSLRSKDNRFAVVSFARMDPRNLGAAPDESLLRSRLRKMVAKNIGIIYYGLKPNNNPRSALFGNILSVDDLDRMTEEFDPR